MWEYDDKQVTGLVDLPEDAMGFIYCIYNLTTGKDYIGKKNLRAWKQVSKKKYEELDKLGFRVKRHKNKSKSKAGKPVWVYSALLETDWQSYTGSNKELNEHIKRGDTIRKVIWEVSECPKKLTFLEFEALVKLDVLRDNEKYYNGNILGKFFPNDLTCNYERL